MSRKDDIFEKLDYADHRFQELCDNIFSAGLQQLEIKRLSTTASEVLSCSREVFDFCACDIAELVIVPNDADTAAAFASGKLRCYYPLHKSQLTKKTALFHKLKDIDKNLHDFLYSVSARALKHPLILYNREHTIERLTPRYGFGEAGHEG